MRILIDSKQFDSLRSEFKERLKKRPECIVTALEEGALVAVEQARKNVSGLILNSGSGRLRKSIMAGRITRRGNTFSIWVGSRFDSSLENIHYGAVWEFGSRMTVIKPKRANALRWFGPEGRPVFSSRVRRPAQAPRPWLRPAVEGSVLTIENILNRMYGHE